MTRGTSVHVLVTTAVLVLFAPPVLRAQGNPRKEKPPPSLEKQKEVPPFCRGEHGRAPGKLGHPRFGMEWCEQEEAGLHGDDADLPLLRTRQEAGIALEPFCRDGSGHPQFGVAWCQEKERMRSGGFLQFRVPGPTRVRSENFCLLGIGHPEFGMEWCTMSEEEWARRRERGKGKGGGRPDM